MAGMACATWRAVDTSITQNSKSIAAQRHHNQELVDAIESLAVQAGVLTSADLCPVRFRLRHVDAHSTPVCPVYAYLEEVVDGEFSFVGDARSTQSGVLEFGLNPPGRYRLFVEMADGMHLQHVFEVLPGVPMDRLVTCPDRSVPDYITRFEIDWPEQLATHELLAVCCIAPAAVTCKDWTWQPPSDCHPVCAVVSNSEWDLSGFDLSALVGTLSIAGNFDGELLPAGEATVSFRYGRLQAITFVARVGEEPETVALGTVVFAEEPVESRWVDPAAWYSDSWMPMLTWTYLSGTEAQKLQLPADVLDELQNRIQAVTAPAQTTITGVRHGFERH